MSGVLAHPHRAAISLGRGLIYAEDIAKALVVANRVQTGQCRCPAPR